MVVVDLLCEHLRVASVDDDVDLGAVGLGDLARTDLFGVVGGHRPAIGSAGDLLISGLAANSGRLWLDDVDDDDDDDDDTLAGSTTELVASLGEQAST